MNVAYAGMSSVGPSRMRFAPESDPYPWVRSAVRDEYAEMSAEDLETVLAREGIDAAAMEGFFDDVGSFIKKAAPVVGQVAQRALPGIVSGATTGAALGPWGALGGALIGGVTSAISSGGRPGGAAAPARAGGGPLGAIAGAAAPALAGLAGGAGPLGAIASAAGPALAGLAGGGGGNVAGTLLNVLRDPQVMHSLMSLALGSAGRQTVPVGASQTPVPTSAVANLIGQLGSRAFAQAEAVAEPSEALPAYLYREGQLVVDPGAPEQRAARLLEMLSERTYAAPRRVSSRPMYTEADEFYDAIDIAELEELDMEGDGLEFS